MRPIPTVTALIVSTLFSAFSFGCVSGPPPLQVDPSYAKGPPREIAVMPVIDSRLDTTQDVDLVDLQDFLVNRVEWQGYLAVKVDRASWKARSASGLQIATLSPTQLAKLGPVDAKTVMYVFLEDVSWSYGFLYGNCRCEATAVVVDRDTGRLLWKNRVVDARGVVGILIPSLIPMQWNVTGGCLWDLAATLPQVPEQ